MPYYKPAGAAGSFLPLAGGTLTGPLTGTTITGTAGTFTSVSVNGAALSPANGAAYYIQYYGAGGLLAGDIGLQYIPGNRTLYVSSTVASVNVTDAITLAGGFNGTNSVIITSYGVLSSGKLLSIRTGGSNELAYVDYLGNLVAIGSISGTAGTYTSLSVNGVSVTTGGPYLPLAGGTLTGPLTVTSISASSNISTAASISAQANISATANMYAGSTVAAPFIQASSYLSSTGAVYCQTNVVCQALVSGATGLATGGTLYVQGTTNHIGAVTINNTLSASSNISTAASINAQGTITGKSSISSSGDITSAGSVIAQSTLGTAFGIVFLNSPTNNRYIYDNGTTIAIFGNPVTIQNTLSASSNFATAGTAYVQLTSQFVGAVTCNSTLSASNNISCAATLAVQTAITCVGNITAYSSDARLKKEVTVITDPLEKLSRLRGVDWTWDEDKCYEVGFEPTSKQDTGVIAQEVQKVLPNAVGENLPGYLAIKTSNQGMIAVLIEAVKEQGRQIADLQSRIAFLENK